MAQPSASPGVRRRSDGSVRECLFFPVSERNEQERLEALVRRRAGGTERRGGEGEAQDHLDNRPKRWTWEGPPDGMEGEYIWGVFWWGDDVSIELVGDVKLMWGLGEAWRSGGSRGGWWDRGWG